MVWTVIFIISAGQGVFLAFLLFTHKSKNGIANRFLALLIFLYSLNLLENVAYWTNYQLEIPHIINTTRGFIFLFGPLLFIYIYSVSSKVKTPSLKWAFHFIPFLLDVFFRLDFYLLSAEQKIAIISAPDSLVHEFSLGLMVYPLLICGHLVFYAFLAWRQLTSMDTGLSVFPILKRVTLSFSAYVTLIIIYFVLIHTIDYGDIHDYFISLAAAFFIYQIGYYSFSYPDKIHGFNKKEKPHRKYSKSGIKINQADKYAEEVLRLMEVEQVFLKSDLRISDMASLLDISINHLSQIINDRLGRSFNDLVSEYRVKKAIQFLSNPDNNDKMLAIAYNSGFNNKTSFNNIFKKYTGSSPLAYKKLINTKTLH